MIRSRTVFLMKEKREENRTFPALNDPHGHRRLVISTTGSNPYFCVGCVLLRCVDFLFALLVFIHLLFCQHSLLQAASGFRQRAENVLWRVRDDILRELNVCV